MGFEFETVLLDVDGRDAVAVFDDPAALLDLDREFATRTKIEQPVQM